MPVLHINNAATGDQVLVASPGARQIIRVLGGELSAVTAQSLVALKSGGTTVIWSTLALNAANSQCRIANVDANTTIDTAPGEALNINCAATGNVRGWIEYVIYGPPST